MALFMDAHTIGARSPWRDVAKAHAAIWRLRTRMASITCATGWTRSTARSSAWSTPRTPDAAVAVHREAHGLVADEIFPVAEGS